MTASACSAREACSLCGAAQLERVLELRDSPIANRLLASPGDEAPAYPLRLVICRACGHLQLGDMVDPAAAFGSYRYASGTTSPLTRARLEGQARELLVRCGLDEDGRKDTMVVEVGSNDGTLLRAFQGSGCRVLGVDPAREVGQAAIAAGVPMEIAFLDDDLAARIVRDHGPADLVVANNVLAHTPDVRSLLRACAALLGPNGALAIEVAHSLDLARDLAFDTIYHEHYSYHSLRPLRLAIEAAGLVVEDAWRDSSQVGRGSLSLLCGRPSSTEPQPRIRQLEEVEEAMGLLEPGTWRRLHQEVLGWTIDARIRLRELRRRGEVWGFGAPAKMATLSSQLIDGWMRLDKVVDLTVDESPWKQGHWDPVSRSPIVGPEELRAGEPFACIIFAWNFADDIMRRHASYPGTFVVPLPRWREYPLALRRMEGLG